MVCQTGSSTSMILWPSLFPLKHSWEMAHIGLFLAKTPTIAPSITVVTFLHLFTTFSLRLSTTTRRPSSGSTPGQCPPSSRTCFPTSSPSSRPSSVRTGWTWRNLLIARQALEPGQNSRLREELERLIFRRTLTSRCFGRPDLVSRWRVRFITARMTTAPATRPRLCRSSSKFPPTLVTSLEVKH